MISWILKRMSWKSFSIGVGTTIVGGYVVRPMLVSVIKGGFAVRTLAEDTWQQVQAEAAKVRADAAKMQVGGTDAGALIAEFAQLRNDVGMMKAKLTGGSKAQQ